MNSKDKALGLIKDLNLLLEDSGSQSQLVHEYGFEDDLWCYNIYRLMNGEYSPIFRFSRFGFTEGEFNDAFYSELLRWAVSGEDWSEANPIDMKTGLPNTVSFKTILNNN
jgi:hypothetical protein